MQKINMPLLRYPGSKFLIREWVHSFFIPHVVYLEPFSGAASLLFHKKPATTEIINDINSDMTTLLKVIRDPSKCNELSKQLILTPYSRDEYEKAWEADETIDEIEQSRKFIIKNTMGQKSKLSKSGFDSRINSDGYCGRVNYYKKLPEKLCLFSERLRGVLIENKDGVDLIKQFNRPNTLIYVDPEYINVKKGYPTKFTIDDQMRLRDVLLMSEASIILSGYKNDFYKEWFEDVGWQRHDKKTYADGGHKRIESIWLNHKCAEKQLQMDLFS